MTKREIILHYPWNESVKDAVSDIVDETAKVYGGASAYKVSGFWYDADGNLHDETMLRVIVAIDPAKEQEITDTFRIDLRFLGEQASYWVDIFGGVHIDVLD